MENVQSWEYLGGKAVDMWLLSEKQLVSMCKSYSIEEDGTRDELIARLVRHRNALDSKRMLTDGVDEGSAAKKKKLSVQDLPTNLESLSLAQLKAVCAAHGIVTNKTTKAAIISEIEKLQDGDEPQLRLEGKKE